MNYFNFHADDYAISLNSSKDILSLLKNGLIDSISILPNMPCFYDAMLLLKPFLFNSDATFLNISIHLNFMEGKCCCNALKVPYLVDNNGYFKTTWISLLVASFNPILYQKIKKQLKLEIQSQIEKILSFLPSNYKLCIDSHQHTHMIPIVWHACMELIKEHNYSISFIRLAREPLFPHIRAFSLHNSYSITNLIKNIILNILSIPIEKDMNKEKINYELLWGLILSGNMNYKQISKIKPYMEAYAIKKQKKIELLFHPGSVLPEEITTANTKLGFVKFHLSPNRQIEYDTIKYLMQEAKNNHD